MGSRTTETAAPTTTEEAVAAHPAIQHVGDALSPHGILALQRSIGNAAVAALVARRIHGEDVPERPAATGADAWTETEIKAIQRELKRLGLYSYTIDGDRGPKTNAGLTAAFDSEAWKSMGATEAHEKLKAAKKPDDPGGTRLNYGELFKDGVLDVTFGVGYFEGNPPAEETRQVAKAVMDELITRGYKQDNDTAAEILDKAGRPLSQKTTGQFFVKQNAFSYGPPAGESRQIHAIVRVVFNDVAGGGGAASAAFREGMAARSVRGAPRPVRRGAPGRRRGRRRHGELRRVRRLPVGRPAHPPRRPPRRRRPRRLPRLRHLGAGADTG